MMSRFIRLCGKLKFLGLLGLPGFFFNEKIFDLFWLFWLFGLVEIFYNLPVFVQSIKQLGGMVIIPLRYSLRLPNSDTYVSSIKYSLPFSGNWIVVNGGTQKTFSHSWNIPTQRYAYDFLILDENGKSYQGDQTEAVNYYCYGKTILAPADGKVVEVGSDAPNSSIFRNGQVDCAARDMRGNYILICHAKAEYSLLAHLQPGSICVKTGDCVKRGQSIARCGNSGNSSEPHLHFHLQDGSSFFYSAGLPIRFEDLVVNRASNYSDYDPRSVPDIIRSEKYIARGQVVANKTCDTSKK